MEIKNSTIYGIIGKNPKDLKHELQEKYPNKKIYLVKEELKTNEYYSNLYERMKYEIKRKKLIIKNLDKKIIDSLKIVGVKKELLNNDISILSSSEKRCIGIALSLIVNPDIIIIENLYQYFDKKTSKKINLLFQKIKEQYQKTIIIIDTDSNNLYQYTNRIIFYQKDNQVIDKKTEEFYQNRDFLKKNKIEIPEIVEITNLAKKKNIKLDYHKDIRDIIKDIYKHV